MNLSLLAGNSPLKRQLELETARRGLSHAYILSGPAGSGKRTLAGLLAAALVCAGGGDVPCLSCPHCRKALAGIHPDVILAGEGEDGLNVAAVRALRSDAYIRPNEAGRKVYILANAQNMNDSAQNAMLKLLEEGPAYAAFLLLTDNAAALLPTVRSRCEELSLSPVTQAEAEEWLAGRFPGKSPAERADAARRCEGLLGRAAALLEGRAEEENRAVGAALELVRRFAGGDELALAEFCAGLERDKWDRDGLRELLDQAIFLLRDSLLAASGALHESDPARREAAQAAARALPPKALSRAVETLEQLRRDAAEYNLGAGHLAGWLAAGLST